MVYITETQEKKSFLNQKDINLLFYYKGKENDNFNSRRSK